MGGEEGRWRERGEGDYSKRIIRFYLFMANSFMQCVDDFMDILLYRSRIIVTKTLMKKRKEKESYI